MSLNPLSPNYLKYVGPTHPPHKLTRSPQKSPQRPPKVQKIQPKPQKCPDPPVPEPVLRGGYEVQALFPCPQAEVFSHFSYFREGYLLAFTTRSTKIAGRALIVFPEGMLANCYVWKDQLEGWAVICQKNIYCNICFFRKGKFEGQQFSYDMQKGFMSEAFYKNNQLQSIHRCLSDKSITFEKFVNNPQLMSLLTDTYQCVFLDKNYPKIESSLGNYYGQHSNNIPDGLGLVISENDFFYGQFEQGVLHGRGAMSFDNGSSYVGEVDSGAMAGWGCSCTNGKYIFRLKEMPVPESLYKKNIGLASFDEHPIISQIFGPMVAFYIKLRELYLKKYVQVQSEVSLVDVKDLVEEDQQEGEFSEHNSNRQNYPKEQEIRHSAQSFEKRQFSKRSVTLRQKSPKKINIEEDRKNDSNNYEHLKDKSEPREPVLKSSSTFPKQELKKEQQKPKDKVKSKQNAKAPPSNNEWMTVKDELMEDSVGREDGFYQPPKSTFKDSNKEGKDQFYKGNEVNSRMVRDSLVKLRDRDSLNSDNDERAVAKMFDRFRGAPK